MQKVNISNSCEKCPDSTRNFFLGVIHSDLKPANFLRAEGGLKLIDFGIASKVQEDMTCVFKSTQEGSCNYISPEALSLQTTGNVDSPNYGKPKYKVSKIILFSHKLFAVTFNLCRFISNQMCGLWVVFFISWSTGRLRLQASTKFWRN